MRLSVRSASAVLLLAPAASYVAGALIGHAISYVWRVTSR